MLELRQWTDGSNFRNLHKFTHLSDKRPRLLGAYLFPVETVVAMGNFITLLEKVHCSEARNGSLLRAKAE